MTGEQSPDSHDLEVLQLLDALREVKAHLAAAEARVAELERSRRAWVERAADGEAFLRAQQAIINACKTVRERGSPFATKHSEFSFGHAKGFVRGVDEAEIELCAALAKEGR